MSWWAGEQAPPFSEHGLFAADTDLDVLVAGVCIYPTEGPYSLLAHLRVNKSAPIQVRAQAVDAILAAASFYAASTGRSLLIQVDGEDTAARLSAAGWEATRAVCYTLGPFANLIKTTATEVGGPSVAVEEPVAPQQQVQEPPKAVKRRAKAV